MVHGQFLFKTTLFHGADVKKVVDLNDSKHQNMWNIIGYSLGLVTKSFVVLYTEVVHGWMIKGSKILAQ
jgi:hypothetical protein